MLVRLLASALAVACGAAPATMVIDPVDSSFGVAIVEIPAGIGAGQGVLLWLAAD